MAVAAGPHGVLRIQVGSADGGLGQPQLAINLEPDAAQPLHAVTLRYKRSLQAIVGGNMWRHVNRMVAAINIAAGRVTASGNVGRTASPTSPMLNSATALP